MVSRTKTFAFNGIEALPVDVQCQLSSGTVNFTIVGLPDKSVAESRERIRSVFSSIGLSFPSKRAVINLSPADIFKEGSHFDLPITLSLLVAMNIIPQLAIERYYSLGEIALDGALVGVSGVLPAAISAASAEQGLICPRSNANEAMWASSSLDLIAANNIVEIINHFKGTAEISPVDISRLANDFEEELYPDFADVKGQETAKRAAEIAASGGHNLLMCGPPGSGKSMIAARLPGIIPKMTPKEILETSMIYSVSGMLREGKLVSNRPFRAPHHNASMPAMIGGGTKAKPGEISLAHNGILFLDELPEFPRQVLDSLRQPIETGEVTISRVNNHITYPSNFQFIAAMNPCKCGYMADPARACGRVPKCGMEYQNKISGPMLDRIDMHIDVPEQNPLQAFEENNAETSAQIKARVEIARNIQSERYKNEAFSINSELAGEALNRYCVMDIEASAVLKSAVEKLSLSMRGYAKMLRVARTIADMNESDIIRKEHMAESLSYRLKNY